MFTLPASPQQNGIVERRIGMVSMLETSPTLRWTGKVGDASAFRVWGSRAFVRDLSADKLSSCACGPAPSGVSQVDAVEPVEVAVDSGASGGAEPERAEPEGAGPGGAELEREQPGGAGSGGAEPERAEPGGAGSGAAPPCRAAPPYLACPAELHCCCCYPAAASVMASLNVLTFDAEGRAVDFEVWLDDLQLFLQCDSKDGLSLFDLTSNASTAPAADADSTARSQWLTCDAAARLAVRNHLPSTERAHFSQYKSARALYDAVVARYSSPTTAALSRLMLPYLFPDLAAFATVADLVAHLRTSSSS
ncbi:unnamed protein product [Closterium sp. NIES-54]